MAKIDKPVITPNLGILLKPIIQAIHLLLPSLDKSMKSLNSFAPKRDRIHKQKANMKENKAIPIQRLNID